VNDFTRIPNALIDRAAELGLSAGEFQLVCCLLRFDFGKGPPHPSFDTLAALLGRAESKVRDRARRLELRGLLRKIYGQHKAVTFDLTPLFEKLGISVPYRPKTDDKKNSYRPKTGGHIARKRAPKKIEPEEDVLHATLAGGPAEAGPAPASKPIETLANLWQEIGGTGKVPCAWFGKLLKAYGSAVPLDVFRAFHASDRTLADLNGDPKAYFSRACSAEHRRWVAASRPAGACPKCGKPGRIGDKVLDEKAGEVRQERTCEGCGHTWETTP